MLRQQHLFGMQPKETAEVKGKKGGKDAKPKAKK